MTGTAAYWTALLIMVVGVLGTFVPLLPGIPLILGAMVFYGWVEGFQAMSPWFLLSAAIVTAISLISDYLVAYWHNKKTKADPWSLRAAIAVSLAGLLFLGPLGFLIGLLAGAFFGQYHATKDVNQSLKAAWGMALAFLGGAVFRILLAVSLVIAFLIRTM